jgi:hypothetical protein
MLGVLFFRVNQIRKVQPIDETQRTASSIPPVKQDADPTESFTQLTRKCIMKTSYAATIALVLATLGSTASFAADTANAPEGKTRAQVLAELQEAQRTGDIVDGRTDKKLNELYPSLYPAKAVVQGPTREQVLAELAEAKRTGDIVDGRTDKKLNELFPELYPTKAVAQAVTRAQVLAELEEAKRNGDLIDGRTGKKFNELFPELYRKG